MAYDFSSFKEKLQGVEDWLATEYTGVRTGRATPAIWIMFIWNLTAQGRRSNTRRVFL